MLHLWKKIEDKHPKDKKYCEIRDHSHSAGGYRGAAHSISNLKYSVPIEIFTVFHDGSNYNYIILSEKI